MLEYFRHTIIKNVITGFGTLFNDIHVARYDENGVETKRIKVPITYAPKQKWVVRAEQEEPELTRSISVYFPRMSYELTNLSYDTSRKLPSSQKSVAYTSTSGQLQSRHEKVPYVLTFQLNVIAKNTEDGFQIIEQILPYFSPDFCLTFKTFPIDNLVDVPISIGSVKFTEDYDGSFEERKVWIATIEFTAKVNFYGPVSRSKVITHTDVTFTDFEEFVLYGVTGTATGYDGNIYSVTGQAFADVSLNVTGGATAGSIGQTGTIDTTIVEY